MTVKSTYIPKLDHLLKGGLPKGKSLAFIAEPGVPSHIFGFQVIGERLKNNGEKGFIFTNISHPNTILNHLHNFGWNVKEDMDSERLFFVDSASIRVGMPGIGKYNIPEPSQTSEMVSKAIEDIEGGTGVIMDVAMLLDSIGIASTLPMINEWNRLAEKNDVNLIYVFTKWEYDDEVFKSFAELVDCEVSVRPIVERVIFKQVFSVTKSNWTEHSDRKIFFETLEPGGVKAFIPKLLVTGPYNAGKTSFVKAIAKESVSVDRQAFEAFPTTVALDIGHLEHRGFSADIFGTPGQERFDLLLETLAREAMGTFILVDSTRPETFKRAEDMIRLCRVEAIPKVVVANKQDLDDALTPEKIRENMNISKKIPIVPVSVMKKEGIDDAVDTLLDMVYR
jgi:small GTP-binding protein